ncbi:hypothetical protein [Actinomadura formosensis]|uniref:hypothetical protein n=1 Tax=Actinomadura formosensis TaxID=60706 RepID=UPI001040FE8D|nr:hypothetical protein [Actinomadura formosensis]
MPQRVGRPSWVVDDGDVENLPDDVRHHCDDGPASVAAVRELASGDLDETRHETAVDALADLIVNGAGPAARESAVIALAEIDQDKATTALYRMFDRHGGHGSAGRLLAYFTGEDESPTEELIASLPGIGNFLGALTSAALGERGAAAVPAVHAALRAFPFPSRHGADHWFRDESTKYRLMYALGRAGAAAAPATPTLLAVLEDEEIYRDTRHQAKVTLQAIGLPETADTIAAEIRRRADLAVHDEDDGFSLLLDVLLGMPPSALAASREVGPALEAVRRRFGDGIRTYEEDGELREYTVFGIRLHRREDHRADQEVSSPRMGEATVSSAIFWKSPVPGSSADR